MNTASRIIGNHAQFFRDGVAFTVPTAGTAGSTAKPGALDAGWIDLGIVSKTGIEKKSDEKEIWAPTPGVLRLKDVIENKRDLTFNLTAEEMSPLAYEALLGTLPLDNSSENYNPLSQGKTLKGWLKIQQYDQNERQESGEYVPLNTIDVFVYLKVNGEVEFGENVVTVPFQARVLHSTLNAGTLDV